MAFKELNNKTTSADDGGSFDSGDNEQSFISSESATNALQSSNSAAIALAAKVAAEVAETNAETAETNAEAAQAAAEVAQSATEALYDTFDDRYLGAKSTSGGDPTVDNDGNALIDGALFFDTTNNITKVYNLGTTSWLRVGVSSSELNSINTVSGISSDVTTLASISSDVTTAANNDANITTVAGISGNVTTVAGISGDVTSVAGISANITSVAGVTSDVTTVAGISGNVSTVAGISSDVATVAADGTDIGIVAGIASNITTVAGDSADIQSLGALSSEIGLLGVASVITDMSTLGASDVVNDMSALGASSNITAMGLLGTSAVITDMGILGTVDVVADMNVLGTTANVTAMNVLGTSANVTAMSTVSGSIADVTAVAADATDIGTVATDLSGSDNIGTVAGSISNVNNVGGSIASVNTVANNLASVNSFGETYRIAASDPTTSLDEGDLYFDTTNNVMKVYDGSAWVAAYASLSGALAVANNLSDLSNVSAARTNLGLGSAATTAASDYATAAQGIKADSALQSYTVTEGDVTAHQSALSITESQISDLGSYEAADSTILKDADIGVNVQAFNTNTVVDANYVSTENDFTTILKNKLDNIEAAADVTDVTNVTAAGALMDSEVTNLAEVKAFASADYATAAQGTTADAALPKAGGAMTGPITTNSTFDGVDIAARDAVLTSTTTTANAALPKAGGTMTGDITLGANKAIFGTGGELQVYNDGTSSLITASGGSAEPLKFQRTHTGTYIPSFVFEGVADSFIGPNISLKHVTTSPSSSDTAYLTHDSTNDAAENVLYSQITFRSSTVTDGSEEGSITFKAKNSGADKTLLVINPLHADVEIGDDGAVLLSNGTTAQRPSTGQNGMLRYNTDDAQFEGYADGAWGAIAGGGGGDTQTATTTSVTETAIATYTASSSLGIEITVIATDTVATERTITKLLVTHDGTTAVATEYGGVSTATAISSYDVDISGSNVRLLATAASTNSTNFTVSAVVLA